MWLDPDPGCFSKVKSGFFSLDGRIRFFSFQGSFPDPNELHPDPKACLFSETFQDFIRRISCEFSSLNLQNSGNSCQR